MKEEKYSFNKLPEEFYYEFFSEGPKGTIKKVVRYRLIQEHPSRIYNLGFGDWNEEKSDIEDMVATNNQDRQKGEKISRYAKASYFREKDKKAMEFLKKHPLPSEFLK